MKTTRLKFQLHSPAADRLYRNSRHQPDPRLAGHHRRATNVLDAADNDEWGVGSILPRRSSPRAHSRVDHGLNKALLFNAAAKHTREAALQLCTVGQCEAMSQTEHALSLGNSGPTCAAPCLFSGIQTNPNERAGKSTQTQTHVK